MPEIQPLPTAATDPDANLERGNPRFGFGTAMPLGAYFVLLTVVWWGIGVLLQLVQHPGRVDAAYLIIRAVGALLFGGALTAVAAYRQRRNGGRDAIRRMHRAVRTGELPNGADRATWDPALDWRERQLRRSRWLVPVFSAVFAAMGVALAMLDPRELVLAVVTVLLFAALTIWQEIAVARQLPRIRSLKQQLAAQA